MFILRDLLTPLQQTFSETAQGQKRKVWFVYTLLAVAVPFTSSITSNVLRTLRTLFGLELESQRFYAFMASSTLPWQRLWRVLWGLIPNPTTAGRVMVALDDSINTKTGKTIFGCGHFHDHAAKGNQSDYPWSQCMLAIGLLKRIKGRWACLPLDFRFYLMQKDIEAKGVTVRRDGAVVAFETKMDQAATMLKAVFAHFGQPVLVVTDSWFGNDGLWSRLARGRDGDFQLLSRLRSNLTLYDLTPTPASGEPPRRGRPRKYGARLGSVAQCALGVQGARRDLPGVALRQATRAAGVLAGGDAQDDEVPGACGVGVSPVPLRRSGNHRPVAQRRADHRVLRRALENRIRLQGNQAGHRQRQVPDAHRARRQQSSELLPDGDHPDLDLRRSPAAGARAQT